MIGCISLCLIEIQNLLITLLIELLKNSMVQFSSKTASNTHFNEAETDRELIFQQF